MGCIAKFIAILLVGGTLLIGLVTFSAFGEPGVGKAKGVSIRNASFGAGSYYKIPFAKIVDPAAVAAKTRTSGGGYYPSGSSRSSYSGGSFSSGK